MLDGCELDALARWDNAASLPAFRDVVQTVRTRTGKTPCLFFRPNREE
jgi:hypothetical protein